MLSVQQIAADGIIPVVVLEDSAMAVPTAKALLAGGIKVMEITFRTAAAAASIEIVAKQVPEMIVGAGTIIHAAQARQAVEAGAKFLVSPGLDPDLVREAQKLDVPIIPGAVTPSEIMQGLRLGLSVFKFFPAENYGGVKTIKALCGPFPQIQFIPTGGVNLNNVEDYLRNPKVAAVGGSWMVGKELISAGKYEEITQKSADAVALFKTVRG